MIGEVAYEVGSAFAMVGAALGGWAYGASGRSLIAAVRFAGPAYLVAMALALFAFTYEGDWPRAVLAAAGLWATIRAVRLALGVGRRA